MSVIKMIAGLTPTRQRLHKLHQVLSSICPLCNIETEDITHVLYCPENTQNIHRNLHEIIKKLKRYGNISQVTKKIVQKI
jgi:hypothetical protein